MAKELESDKAVLSTSSDDESSSSLIDLNENIYWYVCGPTVYDHSHLGHARTYVTNDILVRALRYTGHNVMHVMNITNIDDKIIKKASEENVTHTEVSERFTKEFFNDMDILGVERPNIITKVTDYVTDIIDYVGEIISHGLAYESSGSVYLDISEYYRRGYSDHIFDTSKLDAHAKSFISEKLLKEKKDHRDFALWKRSKDEEEPSYDSPWGKGRPAWHIECSVMIEDTLEIMGSSYHKYNVIHAGGEDLKFPHHENEMKQFTAHGANPIGTFIHYGRLNIGDRKMSKSEKNYITIKEILEKGYNPNVLRVLFMYRGYNEVIDYNPDEGGTLSHAKSLYDKIDNFIKHANARVSEAKDSKLNEDDRYMLSHINVTKDVVKYSLSYLKIDESFISLFYLVETGNKYLMDVKEPNIYILNALKDYILEVFTALGFTFGSTDDNSSKMNAVVDELVKTRDAIRAMGKNKEFTKKDLFKLTDEIRDVSGPKLGFTIEDRGNDPSIWYYS